MRLIVILLLIISCQNEEGLKNGTKRAKKIAEKLEREIKLPINEKFKTYSLFESNGKEYLSYLSGKSIYRYSIEKIILDDSLNIFLSDNLTNEYGEISSFCNNGIDSIFILFDKALVFFNKKKVEKVIRINALDTIQFKDIWFANLENAPISFNKFTNEIIGQVYSTFYPLTDSLFYKQPIIGKLNIITNHFSVSQLSYPRKFKSNYFGFANRIYISSIDSTTAVSFSCDENVFLLNTNSGNIIKFPGRSLYQVNEPQALPLSSYQSREEKMRHLITCPQYFEIKYDPYNNLYYRFFLKEIPIKKENGMYNSLDDKGLVLMVLNTNFEVIGEYELDKYYINYISFPGKQGLYINYISKNPDDRGSMIFKILTFK